MPTEATPWLLCCWSGIQPRQWALPAARRPGLEVVEKPLTSTTAGSRLAFGQATSRSSWISLSLTADMCDQGLTQLLLGELVT
jgi:hypothetical protein